MMQIEVTCLRLKPNGFPIFICEHNEEKATKCTKNIASEEKRETIENSASSQAKKNIQKTKGWLIIGNLAKSKER